MPSSIFWRDCNRQLVSVKPKLLSRLCQMEEFKRGPTKRGVSRQTELQTSICEILLLYPFLPWTPPSLMEKAEIVILLSSEAKSHIIIWLSHGSCEYKGMSLWALRDYLGSKTGKWYSPQLLLGRLAATYRLDSRKRNAGCLLQDLSHLTKMPALVTSIRGMGDRVILRALKMCHQNAWCLHLMWPCESSTPGSSQFSELNNHLLV